MKVLIVENGSNNIDLVAQVIQNLEPDVSILVAKNGEEGLLDAWFHQPDLLITGLAMPKMDGFEVARQLKEDERTKIIPVVMVTALRWFGCCVWNNPAAGCLSLVSVPTRAVASLNFAKFVMTV